MSTPIYDALTGEWVTPSTAPSPTVDDRALDLDGLDAWAAALPDAGHREVAVRLAAIIRQLAALLPA